MAYDESSVTGDEICDYYYDIENNLMNPSSPTGYFIYKVIGGCFDWLGEIIGQFRIDLSILDCNVGNVELVSAFPEEPDTSHAYYVPNYTATGGSLTKYSYNGAEWVSETVNGKVLNSLDTFWGKSYNKQRPVISYELDGDTYSRVLTDEEYKIYLYLQNHQLMTMKDLLVAFGNAFGGAEATTTTLNTLHLVNHKQYDNPQFSNSTLAAYDPEDLEIVTDTLVDQSGVSIITDRKTEGTIITIQIPSGYDPIFLSFLETFVSVKGNVLISQGG